MDFDKNKWRFLTTYKKDYVEKSAKLRERVGHKQEFEDPISEGFRKFLTLDETDVKPPNQKGDEYLEKFKKDHKKIAKVYFEEPLDQNAIMKYQITKGAVTEYQTNYCDIEKDIQYYLENRTKKHNIPEEAVIPLTTYGIYYRDLTKDVHAPLIIIPPNNLGTFGCSMVHESEYTDQIGRFGHFILEQSIRGKERPET